MVYLKEHLKKYPLMQIEDVLKLYLQGILGPAHAVDDFDNCLKRTINEYQNINYEEVKDNPLIETISDCYSRIYLYPFYQQFHNFDRLVKYFVLSSQDDNDIELFKNEIKKLINNDNENFIKQYLSSGNYLISHSQIYKDNYHPHYLVINNKYLKDLLENEIKEN